MVAGALAAAVGGAPPTLVSARSPGATHSTSIRSVAGPSRLDAPSVTVTGSGSEFVFDPIHTAGPAYTWNEGNGLARTATTSSTFLHGVYATDRVGGQWANDSGVHAGAYYIRSSNGGSTWTSPKRLNASTYHAERASIVSAGRYVYTTWVREPKWLGYTGSLPRTLYFRRNTSHGASTAWSAAIRLTSLTGRVDYPIVAAAGAYVYVAYTNSSTGAIVVKRSADHGSTWTTTAIGTTTLKNSDGYEAIPTATASGSNVGVAWIADGSGTVKARISTTNGSSYGSTVTLGTTRTALTAAGAGGRLGFGWTAETVQVRTWTAGSWSPTRTLPATDGYSTERQSTPAIRLQGTSGIAVVYSACTGDCGSADPDVVLARDLVWRASTDGGASWEPSRVVTTSSESSARRANDWPSLVWPTAATPTIMWNGWTEGTNAYRLYVRSGR